MLPAPHRLRHKKDFEIVFTKGLKAYGKGLGLRFGKRYKTDAPTRFGFVVGTKVSKDAVVRNRLKRQMRAAVSAHMKDVVPGFDVVLIAFPDSKELDFSAVREQITALLKKAKLCVG